MIGVFLALLELIREKKILVKQADEDLSDMEIDAAPPEHRKTYEHASLGLADDRPEAPADAQSEPEPQTAQDSPHAGAERGV